MCCLALGRHYSPPLSPGMFWWYSNGSPALHIRPAFKRRLPATIPWVVCGLLRSVTVQANVASCYFYPSCFWPTSGNPLPRTSATVSTNIRVSAVLSLERFRRTTGGKKIKIRISTRHVKGKHWNGCAASQPNTARDPLLPILAQSTAVWVFSAQH